MTNLYFKIFLNVAEWNHWYHKAVNSAVAPESKSLRFFLFKTTSICLVASTATHCNTLQHTVTHFNKLQHTATHYKHTATHCKR